MNTYKSAIGAMWITAVFGICSCSDKSDDKETVEGVVTSCTEDAAACPAQELCVLGLCRAVCERDQDCTNGAVCLKTLRGGACVPIQDDAYACFNNTNCPEGMKCIDGRCRTECGAENGIECLPGNTCMDGVCQPNGTEPSSSDASASGTNPDASQTKGTGGTGAGQSTPDAGKTAAVCPPNSAQCRGNMEVVCDAQGKELPAKECPFVCRSGKCAGVCKPGARQCDKDQKTLQNCEPAGEWKTIETCTSVCTPNGCTPTCTQGELQCNGSTLMVCKDGQMTEKEKCPNICKDKACTGVCVPGTSRCRNNGVETCNAEGRWSTRIACQNQNTCVDGVCRDCNPGSKQCVGTDGAYRTCNDNGEWGDEKQCDNACVSGECRGTCSPGAIDCQSDNVSYKTCDNTGDWSRSTTKCQNQTCVDDECAGVCAYNQKQCKKDSDNKDTNVRQTCSDEGEWEENTCGGSTPACLSGECVACTPKDKECDGNARYRECSNEAKWVSTACPNDKPNCTGDGACIAGPSCNTPHWEQANGNKTLNDPLWAGAQGTYIGQNNAGDYRMLLDLSNTADQKGQLVVSIRATPGQKDTAATNDQVYFGIASADGKMAQAVIVPLISTGGTDPKKLGTFTQYEYKASSNAWTETKNVTSVNWLINPYAWVNPGNESWSWAVAFRVDLKTVPLNGKEPFRAVIGLRMVRGNQTQNRTDLIMPIRDVTTFDALRASQPSLWPNAQTTSNSGPSDCVRNVMLNPIN